MLKSSFHVFLMGFRNEIFHKILKKTWKFISSIKFDKNKFDEKNICFLSKKYFFIIQKDIVFSFKNTQESSEMMKFWTKDENFTVIYRITYIYHGKIRNLYIIMIKVNISAHIYVF